MIKKTFFVVGIIFCISLPCRAVENSYDALCTNVVAALTNKQILVSSSFTNQLYAYLGSSDVRLRSLAKLTLAISLFDLFEKTQGREYDVACRYCTNILNSADLPNRSWQKSAASLLYASALHMDGKRSEALEVCRTALSTHLASPTTNVERAVWSAMSKVEPNTAEFSIEDSLRIAAALSVPAERRDSDWSIYTNNLPANAIQILRE